MKRRMPFLFLLVFLLASCQGSGTAAPPAIPQGWSISSDKYVFVERWIEIYQGNSKFIDFPTYVFDIGTGELRAHVVPPDMWLQAEDIVGLKVIYGRGTSRTGYAGGGANSKVFPISELPFTEPVKDDTGVEVTIEGVDSAGVAYLKRADRQIVLQPGQDWTRDGKSTVEWGGVTFELSARERISNYGILDKSRIQVAQ